ncbi:MAG TPA: AlkA N-terminal domain-containing protein, partial [Pseudonocardiaceae bacterium]
MAGVPPDARGREAGLGGLDLGWLDLGWLDGWLERAFWSPAWRVRNDLPARALRLIADGVVQRHGVPGLAVRLGCTDRELSTVLLAELGAGPLALAEAYRAHTARMLLNLTDLPRADVAYAAGYAGLRQLDEALVPAFGVLPAMPATTRPGTVSLRLPTRLPVRPADWDAVLSFLVKRAVPGVESGADGRYGRTLALPHAPGTVWLGVVDSTVEAVLRLGDLRDLGTAVYRLRRLMDLDTDPVDVDSVLAADPALAPSVLAAPGIRVPGAVDGAELVLRAMLGQQVSVAAARTVTWRLVEALGTPLGPPVGSPVGSPVG